MEKYEKPVMEVEELDNQVIICSCQTLLGEGDEVCSETPFIPTT